MDADAVQRRRRAAPEPRRGVYTTYWHVPYQWICGIGQPILQGRDFDASDAVDAPLVCIVGRPSRKRFSLDKFTRSGSASTRARSMELAVVHE